MHGCDHLKCLNVSVSRVGGDLTITTNRLVSDIQVDVKPMSRLFVSASVICSVNKDSYLRVSTDVVWLTPDMLSGEFDIYSNVVWKID